MAIVPPKAAQLSNCLLAETFALIKILSKVEFFSAERTQRSNTEGVKIGNFSDVLSCSINKMQSCMRSRCGPSFSR